MDKKTEPYTFNNYDKEKGRILITPHGPDPILYGIRGEDPHILVKASQIIILEEPVERWVIFRTNHGTDMHYSDIVTINESKPFRPVVLKGTVAEAPKTITGGHSFFKLKDNTGKIECAAYEPTKDFRGIVRQLLPGDIIKVYGGIRDTPRTLNIEKLEVQHLVTNQIKLHNPQCHTCGRMMKSIGFGKGFRCRHCHEKTTAELVEFMTIPRKLSLGFYEVPVGARRHLSKPLKRYKLMPGYIHNLPKSL